MKTRVAIVVLAAFAILAVACGTSPASSPTAEATPTAVPIDLITADPSSDPEAFRAALSLSQRECYDEVVAEQAAMQDAMGDDGFSINVAAQLEAMAPLAGLHCYDNDTARRLYIGQVDRLAGGLSNASLNCMVELTANTDFVGLFSDDDEVSADAFQADNLMSLAQSIFCLDDGERLAFETNLASENDDFRPGMIDGLECTIDYQDEDGNFVVQDAIALFSVLAQMDDEQTADGIPPQVRELLGTVFDLVPVMVECNLITDEDLADSGLTTDQLVCASDALKAPLLALMDTMSENPEAEMDFGVLANLFSALDQCDIDMNDIEGMDELFGGSGGVLGGGFDLEEATPEIEVPSSTGDLSLEDLEQFLTEAQTNCLLENISEEDIQLMIETGTPPANMFALLATCDITIDQFIEGF